MLCYGINNAACSCRSCSIDYLILPYFQYDHPALMPDGETEPNGNGSFGAFGEADDDDEFIYDDEEVEGSTDFDKDDEYETDENMYEDNVSKR